MRTRDVALLTVIECAIFANPRTLRSDGNASDEKNAR
jgi:hypothetical protein